MDTVAWLTCARVSMSTTKDFVNFGIPGTNTEEVIEGCLDSLDWTIALDYWIRLATGLDYWTRLLD